MSRASPPPRGASQARGIGAVRRRTAAPTRPWRRPPARQERSMGRRQFRRDSYYYMPCVCDRECTGQPGLAAQHDPGGTRHPARSTARPALQRAMSGFLVYGLQCGLDELHSPLHLCQSAVQLCELPARAALCQKHGAYAMSAHGGWVAGGLADAPKSFTKATSCVTPSWMPCVKSRWSQSFWTVPSVGAGPPPAPGSKEGRWPPFLNMAGALAGREARARSRDNP
jgi:hypothetical protein